MRTWFTHHIEVLLLTFSAVFVVMLVLYYVFVIRTVGGQLETALNPNAQTPTESSFNLEEAARLDLKGLGPVKSQ